MSLYLKKRKRLLKKVLIGLSLFGIGSFVFLLSCFLGLNPSEESWLSSPYYPAVFMSLLAIALYKPLDRIFTRFFKRYLFKHTNDLHTALSNLASELETILDLQELGNIVVNTFGEVLHLKTVALFVANPERQDYEIAAAFGWSVTDCKKTRLSETSPLIELIRTGHELHIWVRNRVLRALPWQQANQISHDFVAIRGSWIIPLFFKHELVGMIAFAAQSAENIFDDADFQAFRAIAGSLSKSVRNALQYRQLEAANRNLQDAQSALLQSAKLAAIEKLATGIAHEIHNPLTIISGKAQVFLLKKDRIPFPDAVEDVLKTIVQQTKRAAEITRKLLMFSQGSGEAREPLSLVNVLNDTIALVNYQTSLDGITIATEIHGEIPPFVANLHEMREVFLNLMLNAVQSIGNQGGKIHCDICWRDTESLIEISVLDTGTGIPKENLQKIFNPFFTTRQGGVGLGLFVTQQIIHRYGGSIRVESRVGDGSIFMIYLPCSQSIQWEESKISVNV